MFDNLFKKDAFDARLELPRYIPKEEILGKLIFDIEANCIGVIKDWTYSSDGVIKMVVKSTGQYKAPILIPFSQIQKVGTFIMCKARRNELKNEFGVALNEDNFDEKDKIANLL